MSFPHIASRAFNTPLLVEPRKAVAFAHGLGARVLGAPVAFLDDEDADAPAARRPLASLLGNELSDRLEPGYGYGLVEGVAIVPISGVLIHRGAWVGSSSGQTSYEGIRAQLDAAAENPAVRAIALEIDSFGGEVAGCFGLADRIRAIAALKPVHAFVAEHAFSAAYAIASQADRIILPRTGGVGSIGVLCMHVDMSGALEKAGLAVTLVHAGAHKVDGNPYAPLPDDVRAEFEAEMESLRGLFAETVAKGRGDRLDVAGALATEARCLSGELAVAAGLADAVAEPREAFLEFVAEVRGGLSPNPRGAPTMSKLSSHPGSVKLTGPAASAEDPKDEKDPKKGAVAPAQDDETEEDKDAAKSDDKDDEDKEPGRERTTDRSDDDEPEPEDEDEDEPGHKKAAGSERKRISAILSAPAAAGREELAKHLAFESDMAPSAAIKVLEKAGASAPVQTGRLAEVMRAQGGVRPPAVPSATGGGAPKLSLAGQMKQKLAG